MTHLLRQSLTVVQIAFARLRFIMVFLVAALVVGYWDNIKNHVDKWTRPAIAPDALAGSSARATEFYCPMHPDVVREQEGLCPKCGMPLIKRTKGETETLPADVLARVRLTPQRIALANVRTSPVEYRTLVRQVRAVGVLDYDETKLARLSARVAGRVDELYVTYTGQSVKAGDPVYSLYSPEVYTAQREYLIARQRVNALPKDAAEPVKSDATAVYNASLQKLALWGMSHEQLDRLDEEYDRTAKVPTNLTVTAPIGGIVVRKDINQGQYMQAGDAPYTVADLSDLWLQLKVYERDVPLLRLGDIAEVTVDALPNTTFQGAVTFTAFQIDPETRTLAARVVVDNPGLRLRPGMFATARIEVPIGLAAGIPAPTTASAPPTSSNDLAGVYAGALEPYLKAQGLLAADKAEGVRPLLEQTVRSLEKVRDADAVKPWFQKIADQVARSQDAPIAELRETFKDVSLAMIDIGKNVGLSTGAAAVKVFRCPMKKANWLQAGDKTHNPYYGSEMPDCGSAIELLPAARQPMPATRPIAAAGEARQALAVPRSAVIDTGESKIVYVESSPGVYDMRAVQVGPLAAGELYPVVDGLKEGDRVVTVGTFLVDAENRLNPSRAAMESSALPAAPSSLKPPSP